MWWHQGILKTKKAHFRLTRVAQKLRCRNSMFPVFLAFSSHFPHKRACMPQLFWKKARQIDLPTVKRISFNHWISPFVMEKFSNNKIRDLIHSFKKSSTTFDQRLPWIFGFVSSVLGPLTSWLFRQILPSLELVSYSVVQPRGAFFCLNSV